MPTERRNTRQKDIIGACVETFDGAHFTAAELFKRLKDSGETIARATVYRLLSSMEEQGRLRKFFLEEGSPACYQNVDEQAGCREHFHMMCVGCGEIVHFEDALLSERLCRIAREGGLHIDGSKTVFYGKCLTCTIKT